MYWKVGELGTLLRPGEGGSLDTGPAKSSLPGTLKLFPFGVLRFEAGVESVNSTPALTDPLVLRLWEVAGELPSDRGSLNVSLAWDGWEELSGRRSNSLGSLKLLRGLGVNFLLVRGALKPMEASVNVTPFVIVHFQVPLTFFLDPDLIESGGACMLVVYAVCFLLFF